MASRFQAGVHNAVSVCLGIGDSDRVVIVEDRATAEIAEAIATEAAGVAAAVHRFVIEDQARRPLTAMPKQFGDAIREAGPTASFFIGGQMPNEIHFRQELIKLLTEELRCRHGHMVGIERRLMTDGMAGDYNEIFRVTRAVYEAVRRASRIEVRSRLGTELVATFDPNLAWVPCDGRYLEQGRWGNLPEGETYTAPAAVDGVIAGEEMGDYFAARYGLFDPPVRMRIEAGWLADFDAAGNDTLGADIAQYVDSHPNSRRVGEFAIGTNVGLSNIVGNFLQDEKFPGVHIAFGDPYGHLTGAGWDCPTHVDVLTSNTDVVVDGRQLMAGGRFVI